MLQVAPTRNRLPPHLAGITMEHRPRLPCVRAAAELPPLFPIQEHPAAIMEEAVSAIRLIPLNRVAVAGEVEEAVSVRAVKVVISLHLLAVHSRIFPVVRCMVR